MKVLRPALALALAGVTALSLSASAAKPSTFTLKDAGGDANGLNGQGLDPTQGPATGPAQVAGMDILNVVLANTGSTKVVKKKKVFTCTGFTAALELAAAPQANAIYRITMVGIANASTYNLVWSNDPAGTSSYLQYDTGTGGTLGGGSIKIPVKVEGSKVTWTVTNSDIKATNETPDKLVLSRIGAHDRAIIVAATVPQVDEVVPGADAFKVCG